MTKYLDVRSQLLRALQGFTGCGFQRLAEQAERATIATANLREAIGTVKEVHEDGRFNNVSNFSGFPFIPSP